MIFDLLSSQSLDIEALRQMAPEDDRYKGEGGREGGRKSSLIYSHLIVKEINVLHVTCK